MLQRQNTQRKHRQSWSPKYKPTVTLHHVSMLMLFKETSNILMLSNHYDIQALFLISHPHPLHGKKLQHNLKHLHVQRNHISHSNIRISFIFCFIVWDSAGNITSAQPNTRKMKGIVGGGGGGGDTNGFTFKKSVAFPLPTSWLFNSSRAIRSDGRSPQTSSFNLTARHRSWLKVCIRIISTEQPEELHLETISSRCLCSLTRWHGLVG